MNTGIHMSQLFNEKGPLESATILNPKVVYFLEVFLVKSLKTSSLVCFRQQDEVSEFFAHSSLLLFLVRLLRKCRKYRAFRFLFG